MGRHQYRIRRRLAAERARPHEHHGAAALARCRRRTRHAGAGANAAAGLNAGTKKPPEKGGIGARNLKTIWDGSPAIRARL
nr:MAG TPA: hypothetical protein [Caudoviricetes sp.]